MSYEIARRQTTFWDMCQDGSVVRIHFLGKEEFGFLEACAPSFFVVAEHPLLIDYQFSWEGIYLGGEVAAAKEVLGHLVHSISTLVEDWRPASHYFNQFGAERILREGFGQLMTGLLPLVRACAAVLIAAQGRFSSLPDRPSRWPRQAPIAGRNYVVAKSFRVEAVT